MLPEPQGPWLHPAATTPCPGCDHIVDAERAVCEWCGIALNGEPGTAKDELSPTAANQSGPPQAGPPIQPAFPTYLLAQPLRPAEPIGPMPQGFVSPDQPGAGGPQPLPVTVAPPLSTAFAGPPLPLDQPLLGPVLPGRLPSAAVLSIAPVEEQAPLSSAGPVPKPVAPSAAPTAPVGPRAPMALVAPATPAPAAPVGPVGLGVPAGRGVAKVPSDPVISGIPGPSGVSGPAGVLGPERVLGSSGGLGPSGVSGPAGVPGASGIPAAPGAPAASGVPAVANVSALIRPSQVTGMPAYDAPSPIRTAFPAGPRLQSIATIATSLTLPTQSSTPVTLPTATSPISAPSARPGSIAAPSVSPTQLGSPAPGLLTAPTLPTRIVSALTGTPLVVPSNGVAAVALSSTPTSVGTSLNRALAASSPAPPTLAGQLVKPSTPLAELSPGPAPLSSPSVLFAGPAPGPQTAVGSLGRGPGLQTRSATPVLSTPATTPVLVTPQGPQGPLATPALSTPVGAMPAGATPVGPQGPSATTEPVIKRGILTVLALRPPLWPTGSSGRISGPGG